MGGYREQGGSPTLARLADQARTTMPRPAGLTPANETERLELAAEVQEDTPSGLVTGAIIATCFLVAGLILVADGARSSAAMRVVGGLAVGAIALVVAAVIASGKAATRRASAVAALVARARDWPFPSTGEAGLRDWLVSDRPLVDVTLAPTAAVDAQTFRQAVHAIHPATHVEQLDARKFRLALPPCSEEFRSKHSARTAHYGDVRLLDRLVREMLVPLHGEAALERVDLGGTVAA